MNYEELFLKALVLTICIETASLWLIIRLFAPTIVKIGDKLFDRWFNFLSKLWNPVKFIVPTGDHIKFGEIVFGGWLASFSTIPYLWFLWPSMYQGQNYILYGEIIVVLIETIILKNILRLRIGQAFILSLFCNLASYELGKYLL